MFDYDYDLLRASRETFIVLFFSTHYHGIIQNIAAIMKDLSSAHLA